MVDGDAAQLREHRLHMAAHEGGDVGGRPGRIALPATEKQAAISRQAKIVDHEAAVGDRDVVGNERAGSARGAVATR